MSHYAVLVIGEDIKEQLAPFDENKETPRYVKYTKAQLIAKGREDIKKYAEKGPYADFVANPEKYSEDCHNDSHLNYLKNEFPKRLTWTDDEVYAEEIKWYESENVGPDGEVYSEYNPNSKWDWYSIGGRFAGRFLLKNGIEITPDMRGKKGLYDLHEGTDPWNEGEWKSVDSALKGHIDFKAMKEKRYAEREMWWAEGHYKYPTDARMRDLCYGIEEHMAKQDYIDKAEEFTVHAVVKDGKWYERGKMGWWAIVTDEIDESVWIKQLNKLIEETPDDVRLTIVDCHI